MEIAQRLVRLAKNKFHHDTFFLHPKLNTPVASRDVLDEAITVYPEIVCGNPLNSQRVVRWLLYKPEFSFTSQEFGKSDLFFHYQDYFKDSRANAKTSHPLRIRWIRDDIYKQYNFGSRHGSCYLVRKGNTRPDFARPRNATRIDWYGHKKIAQIFNKKELFFSYDLYTMYCVYAAICGCIPIVVPQTGLSAEQWRANPEDRYGIAYGIDEINWAIETRPMLLQRIYKENSSELEAVKSFIDICSQYFN